MASTVSVISREYCFPEKNINLTIDRDSGATYRDNKKHLEVKKVTPSFHHRQVLQDVAGNPIVTLYKKKMSMHRRWEVYRGENSDSSDLLFSVKQSENPRRKIWLEVFLSNNTTEKVCDFKIKATNLSCVILAGEDSRIIAQIVRVDGNFIEICVYPNIDYAFIVSLVIILNTMMKDPGSQTMPILQNVAISLGTGALQSSGSGSGSGSGG